MIDINPERELKDMDACIDALNGVASDLEGVISSNYIQVMKNVVNEWNDYTKECVKKLLEMEAE